MIQYSQRPVYHNTLYSAVPEEEQKLRQKSRQHHNIRVQRAFVHQSWSVLRYSGSISFTLSSHRRLWRTYQYLKGTSDRRPREAISNDVSRYELLGSGNVEKNSNTLKAPLKRTKQRRPTSIDSPH